MFTSVYNTTRKVWYLGAKDAGKPTYTPFFFYLDSNGDGIQHIVMTLGFATPFHDPDLKNMLGVVNVDFRASFFETLLNPFKTSSDVLYLVETSTRHLIAASNGASPLIDNSFGQACLNSNFIISETSCYLSQHYSAVSNEWLLDGDYSMEIGGDMYAMNLFTFVDATASLNWKVIVVNKRDPSLQESDYAQSIEECLMATIDEIQRSWEIVSTTSLAVASLHGSSVYTPISKPPMTIDPPITGTTQQTFWGIDRSFNLNSGELMVLEL
jgi:hypothetical protein